MEPRSGQAVPDLVNAIADSGTVDALVAVEDSLSAALPEGLAAALRGDTIGHRLHPMLVDLPIGFFTSATVLDVLGGRRGAPMARRLIALGVLSAVPALASGLADYPSGDVQERRRVVALHAASNVVGTTLFALSWRTRRNHRLLGMAVALPASALLTVGGALGGHMAYMMGMGVAPEDIPASADGSGDSPKGADGPMPDVGGVTGDAQRSEMGDVIA